MGAVPVVPEDIAQRQHTYTRYCQVPLVSISRVDPHPVGPGCGQRRRAQRQGGSGSWRDRSAPGARVWRRPACGAPGDAGLGRAPRAAARREQSPGTDAQRAALLEAQCRPMLRVWRQQPGFCVRMTPGGPGEAAEHLGAPFGVLTSRFWSPGGVPLLAGLPGSRLHLWQEVSPGVRAQGGGLHVRTRSLLEPTHRFSQAGQAALLGTGRRGRWRRQLRSSPGGGR